MRHGFVLCVLTCIVAPAAAQAQASSGTLSGRVRDAAGSPIQGAEVQLVGSERRDTTNPRGEYRFGAVPAGPIQVRAAFIGFITVWTDSLALHAGEEIHIDLALPPRPIWNPGNVITASPTEHP
jgi:hypothetical protein